MKKLVCGFGVNNAPYGVSQKKDYINENGERKQKMIWFCPYYDRWYGLLRRSYGANKSSENPSYSQATVNEAWKYFMDFRDWMDCQIWQGLHLDKDILVEGNTEYGPDRCVFVPQYINNLFLLRYRGNDNPYPFGVYKPKHMDRFMMSCSLGKNRVSKAESYNTVEEAHKAWQTTKIQVMSQSIEKYRLENCYRKDVENAIWLRVDKIRYQMQNGLETKYI